MPRATTRITSILGVIAVVAIGTAIIREVIAIGTAIIREVTRRKVSIYLKPGSLVALYVSYKAIYVGW